MRLRRFFHVWWPWQRSFKSWIFRLIQAILAIIDNLIVLATLGVVDSSLEWEWMIWYTCRDIEREEEA